jgi:dihydrofolate synthase/folylpolyglutamate synthase
LLTSISTAQQALEYIHSFDDPYLAAIRDQGSQDWGLSKIRSLLVELGDPHLAYPTVHVAGTKGKGSTAAFITQGLIEAGLKVGLYISPHLQDWRERIQINREPIADQKLVQLVADFKPYGERMQDLSAFEVTTGLAFWHFAREGCDIAVVEVGLGGRLDATSVVEPILSVMTNISLDHMQFLGDTLEEIATDKSAIIKPSTPVVSASQAPEARAVIQAHADEVGSRLTLVGRDWFYEIVSDGLEGLEVLIGGEGAMHSYTLGVLGTFQAENAATALAALREIDRAGVSVPQSVWPDALANTRWPGRMEILSRQPLLIVDGAHNAYSIQRLVEALTNLVGDRRMTIVFGCMADKDSRSMLGTLLPHADRLILTHAEHSRAEYPGRLMALATELIGEGRGILTPDAPPAVIERTPDVGGALGSALKNAAPDAAICVTGSLSVVGEARTLWFSQKQRYL